MPFLTIFDTGKCSLAFVISASHAGVLGSPPRHTVQKGAGAVTDTGVPATPVGYSPCRPYPEKLIWSGEGRQSQELSPLLLLRKIYGKKIQLGKASFQVEVPGPLFG